MEAKKGEIDSQLQEDIESATSVMRKGGIILYPTDTIWGIGCDATNAEAVRRIYDIKRRNDAKSMLALVNSEAMLERYVDTVPEIAYQLIEAAVHPLTLIYEKGIGLADNLLAADGSIGIRITGELFSNKLCQRLNRPIVSTSANISGEKSPACFSDISPEIINAVDYVVKYRQDETSGAKPSNIILIKNNGEFKIIR